MNRTFYIEIPDDIIKELLYKEEEILPKVENVLDIISLYKEKQKSINVCPHCESMDFIKHGTFKGIQRFKCKNEECYRTFSATTKSPWSYSKKDISLWFEYLNLMSVGKSIRYCADTLKIATSTAFYWRHKILSAKNSFVEPEKLMGTVELSKLNFKQNFKGDRNIDPFFRNNRRNIWVASAIDSHNNILSRPICECYFKNDFVEKTFFSKIDKNAFVNVSTDRNLIYLAKKHNRRIPKNTPDNTEIRLFNLNIKRWLRQFRGVASKYLWSYLSWYITIFKNNYKDIIKFMQLLTLENSFKSNKEFIKNEVCTN